MSLLGPIPSDAACSRSIVGISSGYTAKVPPHQVVSCPPLATTTIPSLGRPHSRRTLAGLTPSSLVRPREPAATEAVIGHASSFFTTLPADVGQAEVAALEAVGQPRWSRPNRCRIVACKSLTWTGSSTTFQPISSVLPMTCPPLMPPPAIQMLKANG